VVARVIGGLLGGGRGHGQWQEGGPEQGAVLGGASSSDPDAAGTVEGQRQEPGLVGGAFLPGQLLLQPAVLGVGVDHAHQVASGRGQLGGVQGTGVLQEHGLATGPDRGAGRQRLDRGHDHVGLLGGHPSGGHRLPGVGQVAGQGVGAGHDPAAVAPAEPTEVGEPVTGRAVAEPLLGQVAGVGLGHRTGLDRGQRRAGLLGQLHDRDQLVVRLRRPEGGVQISQLGGDLGQHPRRPAHRAGVGMELRDRHTVIESAATDNSSDIHSVDLDIRDHPQRNSLRDRRTDLFGTSPACTRSHLEAEAGTYGAHEATATSTIRVRDRNPRSAGAVTGPRLA